MTDKTYEFLTGSSTNGSSESCLIWDDEIICRIFIEYGKKVVVRVLTNGEKLTEHQDIKKRILKRYIPIYHEVDEIIFEFFCSIHKESHHSCCNYL